MTDFVFGFTALFQGFSTLISDKKLRAWSLVPFFVGLVFGSALTIYGLFLIAGSIGGIGATIGAWFSLTPGGWAIAVLTLLLWPVALLALGVGVYAIVRIIVAPFYSILAEFALVAIGLQPESPFQLRRWAVFTVRMLGVSLVKSLIFAIAAGLLFICSLIPFVNVIATLGFVLMLSFDVSDYSFEAMGWGIRRRFQHFRKFFRMYFGFAVAMGVLMVIPGMSIVIMPAAVVGGGLLLKRSLKGL